jgi:hypothetical protein
MWSSMSTFGFGLTVRSFANGVSETALMTELASRGRKEFDQKVGTQTELCHFREPLSEAFVGKI